MRASNSMTWNLVFVDDGSTDGSWAEIERLASQDPRVQGVRFRRNFGKAAALRAGFQAARGEIVFTLDADLQDDPHELPRFLEQMNTGLDVVSGWKQVRHDPWHKVGPSRVFNWLVGWLTGVRLHDHNCGFKCYRREIFDEIRLYGELHRFVPVLAAARGWRVGEIAVHHRPRKFGQSKYGVRRFVKGFLDLLTVYFLTGYSQRPQHLLGTVGLVSFLAGGRRSVAADRLVVCLAIGAGADSHALARTGDLLLFDGRPAAGCAIHHRRISGRNADRLSYGQDDFVFDQTADWTTMNELRSDATSQVRWIVYGLLLVTSVGGMVGRIWTVESSLGKTPLLSANDRSRWATVRALVDHGTFALDEVIFRDRQQTKRDREWYSIDMVRHKGPDGAEHFYSSKPPLPTVMMASAYWCLQKVTRRDVGRSAVLCGPLLVAAGQRAALGGLPLAGFPPGRTVRPDGLGPAVRCRQCGVWHVPDDLCRDAEQSCLGGGQRGRRVVRGVGHLVRRPA